MENGKHLREKESPRFTSEVDVMRSRGETRRSGPAKYAMLSGRKRARYSTQSKVRVTAFFQPAKRAARRVSSMSGIQRLSSSQLL